MSCFLRSLNLQLLYFYIFGARIKAKQILFGTFFKNGLLTQNIFFVMDLIFTKHFPTSNTLIPMYRCMAYNLFWWCHHFGVKNSLFVKKVKLFCHEPFFQKPSLQLLYFQKFALKYLGLGLTTTIFPIRKFLKKIQLFLQKMFF